VAHAGVHADSAHDGQPVAARIDRFLGEPADAVVLDLDTPGELLVTDPHRDRTR